MSSAQQRFKSPVTAQVETLLPHSPPLACWTAVSFPFQDAVWCDWIYREFDGMRVPRPLAGRPSRDGMPYPDRISVSPDPSDPEQLETYAQTLKTAQHLIVVVSPGCAKEMLIQDHLRAFRQAGGEERIIALVVKGEPASPSAEPGCEADREWLPKWLRYRFKNNAFEAGPPSEPIVVDARLGVSCLAEVRAQICAALLEVPVTRLAELGVVIRSAKADLRMPDSKVIVPMPEPTPLPTLASLASPKTGFAPRSSRWPVTICAFAAMAALGCLALWPNYEPQSAPVIRAYRSAEAPKVVSPAKEAEPLVAVVAVRPKSAAPQPVKSSEPKPAAPVAEKAVAAPSVAQAPVVSAPAVAKAPEAAPAAVAPAAKAPVSAQSTLLQPAVPAPSAAPVAQIAAAPVMPDNLPAAPEGFSGLRPASGAPAKPAVVMVAASTPASVLTDVANAERKRFELASRRDRLVRLAISKGNAGEGEEAIAAFQQAIEAAHELVNRTDGGHNEVMELGLLYRRLGHFAAENNSAAESRVYFAQGKQVLQGLRAKGKLPKEAGKILYDLDTGSRPSSRDL